MLRTWVVAATCLPLVVRRCPVCAGERFRAGGKFRVNAHHKLLDAWLLVLCTTCGDTAKLAVLERVRVGSVRPGLLDRLHGNDPGLVAALLRDPAVQHRNRIALDWDGAWRLDVLDPAAGDPEEGDAMEVSVRSPDRIPVRPVRLIAEGLGLSRAGVTRLLAAGKLVSAVRLSGRLSGDFTFTLKD